MKDQLICSTESDWSKNKKVFGAVSIILSFAFIVFMGKYW